MVTHFFVIRITTPTHQLHRLNIIFHHHRQFDIVAHQTAETRTICSGTSLDQGQQKKSESQTRSAEFYNIFFYSV